MSRFIILFVGCWFLFCISSVSVFSESGKIVSFKENYDPEDNMCGVDASYLVLQIIGKQSISYVDCKKGISVTDKGTSMADIKGFLEAKGLDVQPRWLSAKDLPGVGILIFNENNHYNVISRVDRDTVFVSDGKRSKIMSIKKAQDILAERSVPSLWIRTSSPFWKNKWFFIPSILVFLVPLLFVAYRICFGKALRMGIFSACFLLGFSNVLCAETVETEILKGLFVDDQKPQTMLKPTSTKNHSLSHTFTLHNRGNDPIAISGLKSSCGCTSHALSTNKIVPGGDALLTFKMNLVPGHKRLSVILLKTDKGLALLKWTGVVGAAHLVQPRNIFYRFSPGNTEVQHQSIFVGCVKFAQNMPYEITNVGTQAKYIQVERVVRIDREDTDVILSDATIDSFPQEQEWNIYKIDLVIDPSKFPDDHGKSNIVINSNIDLPGESGKAVVIPFIFEKAKTFDFKPEKIFLSRKQTNVQNSIIRFHYDTSEYPAFSFEKVEIPEYANAKLIKSDSSTGTLIFQLSFHSDDYLRSNKDIKGEPCAVFHFKEYPNPCKIPIVFLQ